MDYAGKENACVYLRCGHSRRGGLYSPFSSSQNSEEVTVGQNLEYNALKLKDE